MWPPLDIRFSRSSLLLIAIVSATATYVILHGSDRRTPAQLAALAALRDKPHAQAAATTATATTPASGQAGSGSGGSAGGSRAHAGAAGSGAGSSGGGGGSV